MFLRNLSICDVGKLQQVSLKSPLRILSLNDVVKILIGLIL